MYTNIINRKMLTIGRSEPIFPIVKMTIKKIENKKKKIPPVDLIGSATNRIHGAFRIDATFENRSKISGGKK